MKGYVLIDESVKKYLSGDLTEIKMDFDDKEKILLTIFYEDEYHIPCSYQLNFMRLSHKLDLVYHTCRKRGVLLDIERNSDFEKKIVDYLN